MDRRVDSSDTTDALLDAALRSYTGTEENGGLETRLLARTAEVYGRKRLVLLPRVWATGAGLLAAAAFLMAIILPPALHTYGSRRQSSPTLSAVRASKPAPAMAPISPGPHVEQAATRLHRAHVLRVEHATGIVSKPFLMLPPSPQERILLTLNNAQRRAMADMRAAKPTEVQPVEIQTISIAEITMKPLTDSGAQE